MGGQRFASPNPKVEPGRQAQEPENEQDPFAGTKMPRVEVVAQLGPSEQKRISIEIDPKLDPKIRAEIESEGVLKRLKQESPYTAESGREYRLVDGEVFYNTNPSKKNTWGKISDDRPTFAATRTGFTELVRVTAGNELQVDACKRNPARRQ